MREVTLYFESTDTKINPSKKKLNTKTKQKTTDNENQTTSCCKLIKSTCCHSWFAAIRHLFEFLLLLLRFWIYYFKKNTVYILFWKLGVSNIKIYYAWKLKNDVGLAEIWFKEKKPRLFMIVSIILPLVDDQIPWTVFI